MGVRLAGALFFEPDFLLPFAAGLGFTIAVFAVAGWRLVPVFAFTEVFFGGAFLTVVVLVF